MQLLPVLGLEAGQAVMKTGTASAKTASKLAQYAPLLCSGFCYNICMNKYHDGEYIKWVKRMSDTGWRNWLWASDGKIMWQHADEWVQITLAESKDYFRQFVNTSGVYIPDPYEIRSVEEIVKDALS